jgi:hypothetical protein
VNVATYPADSHEHVLALLDITRALGRDSIEDRCDELQNQQNINVLQAAQCFAEEADSRVGALHR